MIACSLFQLENIEKRTIMDAVKQHCANIFDSAFDLLFLDEETFQKNDVESYFPPRYLREHTKRKILNDIYDIQDILYSDVIRWALSPLNTYVIYQLIEHYYELAEESFEDNACKYLLPEMIKNLIDISDISEEDKKIIYDWFTEKNCILDDYCDFYDGDLTDLQAMENLAYLYIYQPAYYQMLGADIEDALDLLPRDMETLFLKAKKERFKSDNIEYDFFISYASEDKAQALLIAEQLKQKGKSVWIDDKNLKIGDHIRTTLEQGLINSKYGIVLISNNYLDKYWTNQELNALFELEERGIKKILPLLLNISHEDVKKKSLFLANKSSLIYDQDKIEEITTKIISDCLEYT